MTGDFRTVAFGRTQALSMNASETNDYDFSVPSCVVTDENNDWQFLHDHVGFFFTPTYPW